MQAVWRAPVSDGPRWLYAAPGRLRAGWRLAVFTVVWLVTQPVVEMLTVPAAHAVGTLVSARFEAYPWTMAVSAWLAMALALRQVDGRDWRTIGLHAAAWRTRAVPAALVAGVALISASLVVLVGSGMARVVVHQAVPATPAELGTWSTEPVALWVLRLSVFLLPAALWEELVFRGYLWTVAEEAGGRRVAWWATSVAFAVVHALNPGLTVLAAVNVGLAGLLLGAVRAQSGSVVAAWAAHLAWNWAMAVVWHVPVSGLVFAAPRYHVALTGPAWVTGGAWGPEGGAAASVMLGAALWWVLRRTRRMAPVHVSLT